MYAKKLRYAASPVAYVAIIALYEDTAGDPVSFVLYNYDSGSIRSMTVDSLEKAEDLFPYGNPSKSIFEKDSPPKWEEATDWLHEVASGGCYKQHQDGIFVEVNVPERKGVI